MKSNSNTIRRRQNSEKESVRTKLKREKESLVSMFLANASHTELASQYQLIQQLHHEASGRPARH